MVGNILQQNCSEIKRATSSSRAGRQSTAKVKQMQQQVSDKGTTDKKKNEETKGQLKQKKPTATGVYGHIHIHMYICTYSREPFVRPTCGDEIQMYLYLQPKGSLVYGPGDKVAVFNENSGPTIKLFQLARKINEETKL